MAYRQTIVAKRLLAFVGSNRIKFYNTGADYSKFIKTSETNVTKLCVFEITDPLDMHDLEVKTIAQKCDLEIDDVKAYIGNFRYEISDIMPVSLAVELATRGYDSPVYGKSLISTGLAVTDLNKVILENDKVDHGEGADLAF